jgi:exodeoxyribonuclease VII large subunit
MNRLGLSPKIYTVSELNANIKALLEESFPFVWICGEISNFRQPFSGHSYFDLKDDSCLIRAVMFRAQLRQLKFEPEDGMSITGMGRISVYEPRGTYQIILEYLEPSGIGALQVAFEKMKARLSAEGYFDPAHKQALPFLPRKISIITSPTGAVVHDIIQIIDRRFANVQLEIIPVKVQGEGAQDEIVAAIELANARFDADVIILTRGGGSIEDMQAFNSEAAAEAIFCSKIPIISAVGHETDFTIADFVADLRAPTPSAAAELVVPEKTELMRRCADLSSALESSIYRYIDRLRLKLDSISKRLIDPKKKIQDLRLRIDDFTARLNRLILSAAGIKRERLFWWSERLIANNPLIQIKKDIEKLEQNYSSLLKAFMLYLDNRRSRLRENHAKLSALSPVAILERGYSITRTIPEAVVVRDPQTVALNQVLEILVAKGTLKCRVKEKSIHGPKNIRTVDQTA